MKQRNKKPAEALNEINEKKRKKGKYGLAKKTPEQLKKVVEEDTEYLQFIHARACYEREKLCNRRKVDYIS